MRDPTDPHKPPDPYAERWRRLEDALLRSAGALDTGTRESLAAGREIPEPLAAYVEKVTRYAYRVTDDDVQALLAAGYSEDQIFEATLSVAFGAAQRRLRAGLDALRGASETSEARGDGEEE
jgi:alkylhydroperoxidase/carboxymuconolactone decarboxylase family protein YurZ